MSWNNLQIFILISISIFKVVSNLLFIFNIHNLFCFSSELRLRRAHLDQRQAPLMEAVEVRTQLPRRRRQGEHQPPQLRHPRQPLHRQAGLDGGPGEEGDGERGGGADVAGGRPGQDHPLHRLRPQPGQAQRVRL